MANLIVKPGTTYTNIGALTIGTGHPPPETLNVEGVLVNRGTLILGQSSGTFGSVAPGRHD